LFRKNVGEDVVKKALRNNRLPCVIIKKDSIDAPPSSLMESIASPKVKIMKGKGIRARTLARNILRVEGRVGALG